MSFLDKVTAILPFGKKEEILEYFFALNISGEKLTAALWQIEGKHLKILQTTSATYSSLDDLTSVTDNLLDSVLGIREIEPNKILFGVPSTWLKDDNLKDENLKILRGLVKELELTPMAYVESANAMVHYLEKNEGVPPTAILVGFEEHNLTVTVVRAGKLDGVKVIVRGDNSGSDIEKTLLAFTAVETLPSKILIYGNGASELKNQLLSFPWMSKLSFLHFPKIDSMGEDVEIKSVCLAGASELEANIVYSDHSIEQISTKQTLMEKSEKIPEAKEDIGRKEDFGFVVGDVSEKPTDREDEEVIADESNESLGEFEETAAMPDLMEEKELPMPQETNLAAVEAEDFQPEPKKRFNPAKFIPKKFKTIALSLSVLGILVILTGAIFLLPKANIKIFVEPKIVEKDATVTADPNQKTVDENAKIIPGQIVNTEISGTAKGDATGKKDIGDPAKGTVIIYNKTSDSKQISKGTALTSSGGLKFTLDVSVTIASQSAVDSGITFGKSNGTVTANSVGADGNLPSGSELTVGGFSSSQVSAKAEGNFSGGTSKTVVVVSSDDQNKLLAVLSSTLRKQAQQKLQDASPQKKIPEEALNEEIVKKSFSKNVGDQATDFSLNLTSRYKGTSFEDKDLKLIVSNLVTTDAPEGFNLNMEATETQADVSKLEKDGKLIFLAKFKATFLPKIDLDSVRNKIKGKGVGEAENIIKSMDNVLGSDIKIVPSLPSFLQRIPLLSRNINIETGLK